MHCRNDWFSNFFLAAFLQKIWICLIALTFISKISVSQCKGSSFRNIITALYTSSKTSNANKLQSMLAIQQQMISCNLTLDSAYMYLLQKTGVLYSRTANFEKAIDVTRASVTIAKQCFKNNRCNTLPIVEGYYNLYYYHDQKNQLPEKYDAIDSCISYSLKEGLGFEIAISALADKTQYVFNKGEYEDCIKNATLGEEILAKNNQIPNNIGRSVFFINLKSGAIYLSGNLAAAEVILENKKTALEQAGETNNLAAIYDLLGLINNDRRYYEKSLDYFKRELKTATATGENLYRAQSLVHIGILYAKNLNKHEEGLQYCIKALAYGDAIDSLFIFKEMGNISVLQHNFKKAQSYFQQSYNCFEQGFDENRILKNVILFPSFNLFQNLFDVTNDKGNAYLQEFYFTKDRTLLNKALKIFHVADLFLAKIKKDQHLQLKSNLVWRNTARSLYEHAIEACYASNNIEDAFYFFEKSRAVLLNDQIYEQRWMTNDDIAKLAQVKKEILELERKLNETSSTSNEYFTIQHELLEQAQQQEILTKTIREKNPLFYENYMDTSSLSLRQLRQTILHNNQSLVEIYSGDSAVYVLSITASGEKLTKTDKQAYDSASRRYMQFIAHRNDLNRNFTSFTQTARQLYSLLFEQHHIPDGSIIISPDGNSFPFEALVINNNAFSPDYFLNHYATSYTYSAKYLTNHFSKVPGRNNNFLGIAPVQYKPETQLATLSGSDQSLKRIEAYYNTVTAFIFADATKGNFMQHFPDYSIIQLYTHASDSSTNGDPVIYFSDSALYLSDLISERKPVTQLVILSACETANGQLYRGEGIFSFNRGFAALGIPAAISNLWSVDEQATYKITELFYKYLSEGLHTDMALQQAKKEFMNSGSKEMGLPYYWAASILTGKVDIIKNEKRVSGSLFIAIASIIIVIVGLIFWRLNKRKK